MKISGDATPDITVVIPTYNRLDTLRLCLKSLETQTLAHFRVIVISDGSTDGTEASLTKIQQTSPLQIEVMHQQNAGPARARNVAIEKVSTTLCLLIGDDILAGPGMLEAHVRFHQANPSEAAVGLGWTKWDEVHQRLTPFMRWYEAVQFDYDRLNAGETPTWWHFYTSNLSFKTNLIRENRFDERFRAAAWEDAELGFRLSRLGKAKVSFLPEAVATHVHPTTFMQALKRMQTIGKSQRLFDQIWPGVRVDESDFKTKLCAFLAGKPLLLRLLVSLAERLKPGKLHAMLLRSYTQRSYDLAGE